MSGSEPGSPITSRGTSTCRERSPSSQISLQNADNEEVADTEYGPGLSLVVGKEWWVSDNWGLGVAAQLYAARMKDREPAVAGGDAPTWRALGLNLLFSASFN